MGGKSSNDNVFNWTIDLTHWIIDQWLFLRALCDLLGVQKLQEANPLHEHIKKHRQ